ncbi:MAG: YitT family protein [Lachnospiraceae bacterium]|nr:YitT family protein [Lachnospiraceae bacterium]
MAELRKKPSLKRLWNMALIVAGNTIYALAVVLFIEPNGLISGGTTGLALFFSRTAGIPVSVFVGGFNIGMFLLGIFVLGREFALTTLFSTVYYPAALAVTEHFFKGSILTQDMFLATVCAGVLIGGGIGLVLRGGASTGGMDIPPLILKKKLGIPVAASLYGFDVLILLLQMFGTRAERILYGLVLVLIYTMVLNKMLFIGSHRMQVKIISREYERISRAIQERMDRGTTLFEVEGGHLREESYAVLTVLDGRELSKLNTIVMELDPKAFLIINQVSEVRGRGFTLEKRYMEAEDR